MATLLEDLSDIEEKAQGLVENKVANFAYTQEAYDNDDVDGVSEYDVNNAQNIPTAEAEILDVNTTVLNKGYRSQASSITRMLMNHFLGRTSYNLNKSVDLFKKGFLGIKNAIGNPNGIATLDENGYLSKEQTNTSLTKEKLKEFLFSGKEPSLKDLATVGTVSTNNLEYICYVRSINNKEDIIFIDKQENQGSSLFPKFNTVSVSAYKYDRETLTEITNITGSYSFICEYKNYALFYSISSTSTETFADLAKFNFNTLDFETIKITLSFSASAEGDWACTFNKQTECFDLIRRIADIGSTADMFTSIKLISVNLSDFTQSAKTLYIPNQPKASGVGGTTNVIILSGNLIALYASVVSSEIYIYLITDLTKQESHNSLITGYTALHSVLTIGTKFCIYDSTDSNLNKVVVLDNGNLYLSNISVTNTLGNPKAVGDYIVWDKLADNNSNVSLVYKNATLCTELPINYTSFKHVYDSVFFKKNNASSGVSCYLDVENSANVANVQTSLEEIKKSDRRAYVIQSHKLYEITNALD